MPLASYALSTYNRPEFASLCVEYIERTEVPSGWELEIVVAAPDGDPSIEILAESGPWPVRVVTGEESDICSQWMRRMSATRGDLVINTADDDLHHPRRLRACIEPWEMGASRIGFNVVQFVDLATGRCAQWEGPPSHQGTTLAYDGFSARVLRVKHKTRYHDRAVRDAIAAQWGESCQAIANVTPPAWTVCLQHAGNISGKRPFPTHGETITHGAFQVRGLGDVMSQPWPLSVRRDVLGLCAPPL